MGTDKKSKSGSELPKGSAAPSCKLSALCLPRALLLSGAAPKGSRPPVLAPGWPLSVGVTGHPITPVPPPLPPPSAAAPAEGAAWKGKLAPRCPLPLPEGAREGGGGSQARGRRGWGAQLALPCCCGGHHGGRGPPGGGGGRSAAGVGTPAGLAPLRHGSGALPWALAGARIEAGQPVAGFGSGCAHCAQARTGALSGAAGRPHRAPACLQPR